MVLFRSCCSEYYSEFYTRGTGLKCGILRPKSMRVPRFHEVRPHKTSIFVYSNAFHQYFGLSTRLRGLTRFDDNLDLKPGNFGFHLVHERMQISSNRTVLLLDSEKQHKMRGSAGSWTDLKSDRTAPNRAYFDLLMIPHLPKLRKIIRMRSAVLKKS
jgi:hypothetical protein